MRDDWWNEVFYLFAQMNHNNAALVNHLRDKGLITSVSKTVLTMAKVAHDLDFKEIERVIEVNRMLEESPDFQDY